MSIRFVPTHVRSAIDIVETEHERTVTERDALAKFADRISELGDGAVDLNSDQVQHSPSQTLLISETTGHTESQLARVRDIYHETIMSVSHYEEDYGDSLPKSLAEEFGPEIAAAVTTGDQLSPPIRTQLIDATHQARESRHALLQGLKDEHDALETAHENLIRIGADLENVLSTRSFHSWSDEDLVAARDHLHACERDCDRLAADRQDTLHEQRLPSAHRVDHEFNHYLYESLAVSYPVLIDVTSLVQTLRNSQRDLNRVLTSRHSDRSSCV